MSGAWTLTVTAPASNLQLLTQEELRAAAGVEPGDASQDAALATRACRPPTALAGACGIALAGYDRHPLAPLRGEAPLTLQGRDGHPEFRIYNRLPGFTSCCSRAGRR